MSGISGNMNWCWLLGHKPALVIDKVVDEEQLYVYKCERKNCDKIHVTDVKK